MSGVDIVVLILFALALGGIGGLAIGYWLNRRYRAALRDKLSEEVATAVRRSAQAGEVSDFGSAWWDGRAQGLDSARSLVLPAEER